MTERSHAATRVRLLGLDVDGTLLDPVTGELRPGLSEALGSARAAGVQIVLCTGRRFRRASAMAHHLGLEAPLVCNSGALVKDLATQATLWRADFEPETMIRLLDLFGAEGERPLSFIDHDEAGPDFTIDTHPTGDYPFDDYVSANQEHASIETGWTSDAKRSLGRSHFHICAIGDRERMDRFEARVRKGLGGRVLCFVQRSPRYTGWMCEILREDAGKWSALTHLAENWGITADQVCTVGDDQNDRPMIAGAGLGVAMPHAPQSVRDAADYILPPEPPTALADFLLGLI